MPHKDFFYHEQQGPETPRLVGASGLASTGQDEIGGKHHYTPYPYLELLPWCALTCVEDWKR